MPIERSRLSCRFLASHVPCVFELSLSGSFTWRFAALWNCYYSCASESLLCSPAYMISSLWKTHPVKQTPTSASSFSQSTPACVAVVVLLLRGTDSFFLESTLCSTSSCSPAALPRFAAIHFSVQTKFLPPSWLSTGWTRPIWRYNFHIRFACSIIVCWGLCGPLRLSTSRFLCRCKFSN